MSLNPSASRGGFPTVTPSSISPPDPSTAFARFAQCVIREPRHVALLAGAAEGFEERAVRLGAERGFAFTVDEVRGAVQAARRAWVERNVPALAPAALDELGADAAAALRGWTPVHVGFSVSGPFVEWCWLDGVELTEPFFEQTLTRALRDPARLVFRRRTSLAALENLGREASGPAPDGFVFHLSRCGSTLTAQILAALPATRVLSEPPPLDQVLSLPRRFAGIPRALQLAWMRGMVRALAGTAAADRRCFFKLDSWHVLDLPLFREAFPETPWIFLYRDPVEVMVSQQRQRGTQMVPGIVDPQWFGFDPAAVAAMSLDEYCARVLARICDAARAHATERGGRLVNFTELPAALWEKLGEHFGKAWTPDEIERMQRAAQFNAKTPSLPHADDRAAKQREASEEIRGLVETYLREPYARLEALRQGS